MKKQSASVFISTTQGLVEVLSITALLDPELESVVTINHTSHLAGISKHYKDFVEPPQGIIKQDFGGFGYRINLSSNINQGESWQLGIYLAHYLHAQGNLRKLQLSQAEVDTQDDIIFIATGRVDTLNGNILEIDELEKKCLCANNNITTWQKQGKKIIFLVPLENLRVPIPDSAIVLSPISTLHDLESLVHMYFPKPSEQQTINLIDKQKEKLEIEEGVIVDNVADEQASATSKSFVVNLPIILGAVVLMSLLLAIFLQSERSDKHQIIPNYFLLTANTSNTDSCGVVDTKFIKMAQLPASIVLPSSAFKKTRIRLCELSLYLPHQSQDIVLISESKAVIRLSSTPIQAQKVLQNDVIKNSMDRDVLDEYAELELRHWQIPIPSNQSTTRSYHLMIFNDALDEADFQSLQNYMENLHNQQRQHTTVDLFAWQARVLPQKQLNIIQHSLIF